MVKHFGNLIVLNGIMIVFLLAFGAQQTEAVPITFNVQGAVVGFDGPSLSPIAIGQHYSALYTFESTTTGTPVFGGGKDYAALVSASFSIGDSYNGSLASTAGSFIEVLNNHFGFRDAYIVDLEALNGDPASTPFFQFPGPSRLTLIDLEDFSTADNPPTALSSDDLPLTPLSLVSFPIQGWVLEFESANAFGRVRGNISSFALAEQVPEPATFFLMGVGLVGISFIPKCSTIFRKAKSNFLRGRFQG